METLISSSTFPTNKPTISFSEINEWNKCPYRHKLLYIEKLSEAIDSPFLDFGTILHEACRQYLTSRIVDVLGLLRSLRCVWKEKNFPDVDVWAGWLEDSIDEIPSFLDSNFPKWEFVCAEERLDENISGDDLRFKGFIDGVIRSKNKRGKDVVWIIDWKTSASYGWRRDKKWDKVVQSQLILYKIFLSKKLDIPLKDIRCAFVLVKRGGKKGSVCELVNVSAGPKMVAWSEKLMRNMISSVRKGMFLKKTSGCRYCEFNGLMKDGKIICVGDGSKI